jgi:hypothetical protein
MAARQAAGRRRLNSYFGGHYVYVRVGGLLSSLFCQEGCSLLTVLTVWRAPPGWLDMVHRHARRHSLSTLCFRQTRVHYK